MAPFGWRARIGHVHPSVGINDFEEWRRAAPEGVQFITTCMLLDIPTGIITQEAVASMSEALEAEARKLATAHVDLIVQAAVPLAFLFGPEGDKEVIRRIEQAAGVPATTMNVAMVDSLRRLGASRVAVVSPHIPEVNEQLVAWLQREGFQVLGLKAHPASGQVKTLSFMEPIEIYRFAREVARAYPEAEALLISGGAWRNMDILEALESDTGMLAVSSTSASLWKVLDMTGVRDPIRGYGRLLSGAS